MDNALIGMEGLIIKKVVAAGDRILFYCAPKADSPSNQWQMFYVTPAPERASPLERLSHSFSLLDKYKLGDSDGAPTNSI